MHANTPTYINGSIGAAMVEIRQKWFKDGNFCIAMIQGENMVFSIKEVAVNVEENGQVLDTFRRWSEQGLLIGFRM